jgi:hypothetical protein
MQLPAVVEVGGLLLAQWAKRSSSASSSTQCPFSLPTDECEKSTLLPEIALGGLLAGACIHSLTHSLTHIFTHMFCTLYCMLCEMIDVLDRVIVLASLLYFIHSSHGPHSQSVDTARVPSWFVCGV